MSTERQRKRNDPIPGNLNLALTAAAVSAALFLLWFASHNGSWTWRLLAAIAFSYVNNTIFSLLHESVHGIFHPRKAVNEWCGRLTAAFFPTALTFQRICHLGHHRRNRTDAELFDYYTPDDNKLLKFVQWYGILTGLYWALSPLACLLYLVSPRLFAMPLVRGGESRAAQQTGAAAMASGFDRAPAGRIRLEIVFSILVQTVIVSLLDLSVAGWLTCYAAFGFNWSSLQYADHAWSSRDVRDGAWNLKVNKLVQYLFLNYHHHLAHHQHPEVPWLYLPAYVGPTDPRPLFLGIYLKMWLGPRPYPGGLSSETDRPVAL